ncbi:MAG TPA: non-ribosomal peptide synthetase, partial [Polyangium sp.]|nr:non-ribosomal peptide synthetase [Polyangium sp.]
SGAAVVVVGEDEIGDPRVFTRLCHTHRVTHILATPAFLEQLVESVAMDTVPLRYCIVGGARLSGKLVAAIRPSGAVIINIYGPTETSIFATWWTAQGDIPIPPIGQPAPGARVYVLSHEQQLMPIGAIGELYIGGEGVARGYLERPELTNERFFPDPFCRALTVDADRGGRMYRTGDLGRWLPSGNLEFIGRGDRQEKIRGHRIELGGVEEVIRVVAGIQQVAVVVCDEPPGNRRLVAYIGASAAQVDLAALREELRRKIPDYMIPARFVVLPVLPLTSNGEVNLHALPKVRSEVPNHRAAILEPRTKIERRLYQIFRSVLGIDHFSIDEDFFHIGGDSMASMRVVTLAAAGDLQIGVKDILEARTIEGLARRIQAHAKVAQDMEHPRHVTGYRDELERILIRFRTSGKHAPLFLVHPAGGTAAGYRELADALGHEQPVYGLDAPNAYEGQTISTMAASYIRAMQSVQPSGPYYLGGWSLGGMIAFEMARQLEESGQSVALLVMLDARPAKYANQRTYLEHMHRDDAAILSLIARHLGVFSGKQVPISYQALSSRASAERESWFYERLVAAGIFTKDTVEDYVKSFVNNFRSAGALLCEYEETSVNAEILLLRAETISMHYEGFPALEEALRPGVDDSYGWRPLTRGGTRVQMVPGTHEDLVFAPHAVPLARILGAAMRRAEEGMSMKTM